MKAKEQFQEIMLYDAKINSKLEELERLKSLATKVTSVMDGEVVSHTRNTDSIGDTIAKIIEMQNEINNLIDLYVDKKTYLSRIIDSLQKPEQIKVLYGHYFQGKSFDDIAHDLGYTRRNICYIHGAALQEVESIVLKEETKGSG